MTRKRMVLALIACTMLLVAGIEDDCASPDGNRFAPGTAIAGTAGGSSTVGVTVTRPVPASVESLQDVRANAPQRGVTTSRDRVIPFRRIQKPVDTSVFSPRLFLNLAPAVSSFFAPASSSPRPMAPALDNSFAGLNNPPPGPDVIPPDTMGAAGPNHLVSILNSDFGVFSKTGSILSQVTLDSFWASLGSPQNFNPFDPRILFDQHSGRFIASSASGTGETDSWLLIAVSETSDPTGNWIMVAIDADKDNTVQGLGEADYPALGVDNANIYITANMFNGPTYLDSKVWVIPKAQFLGSSPPSPLTHYEFRNPALSSSSMQPAHTFGTPGEQYLIYELESGKLQIASVTFPGGTPTWSPIGVVDVDGFTLSNGLTGMPQSGSVERIDTSDTRLLNAVYRNGFLWTTHTVEIAGKAEVAWYRINPGALTVPEQGRISDPSRSYAYPSIAVNQNSDVAIGFSGSSSSDYASAYYTMRKSGDSPGTMQPVTLLKSGVATYYKTGLTLGAFGIDNRWGDYSATCVDPVDNVSFWTLQEYAETPSAGKSMWGTWWGRFRPSTVNAPTGLTATAVSQTQINLTWTDSINETGYKVERRLIPGGDYSVIATPGANVTAYFDNTGLVAGTTYSYRVQATDATGGSNSAEAQATTQAVPAPGGGGGCAIGSNRPSEDDPSPVGTALILLSPLGVLAWLRRSSVPPRGRPAAP